MKVWGVVTILTGNRFSLQLTKINAQIIFLNCDSYYCCCCYFVNYRHIVNCINSIFSVSQLWSLTDNANTGILLATTYNFLWNANQIISTVGMGFNVMLCGWNSHLFWYCRYMTSSAGYNSQFSSREKPSTSKEQNGISFVITFIDNQKWSYIVIWCVNENRISILW